MAKRITAKVKANIALEALQGHHTVSEIAGKYGVHPNMVTRLKKEAIAKMTTVFDKGEDKRIKELESEKDNLLKIIGKKEQDNDWLKKKCIELGLL